MRRGLLLIVLVLLVGIAIYGPLFERVDHWDHFPQQPDDIVLTVTILAVCLGTWLLATPVAIASASRFTERLINPVRLPSEARLCPIPVSDQSPPLASLALRI
jgi:hypothetical protein